MEKLSQDQPEQYYFVSFHGKAKSFDSQDASVENANDEQDRKSRLICDVEELRSHTNEIEEEIFLFLQSIGAYPRSVELTFHSGCIEWVGIITGALTNQYFTAAANISGVLSLYGIASNRLSEIAGRKVNNAVGKHLPARYGAGKTSAQLATVSNRIAKSPNDFLPDPLRILKMQERSHSASASLWFMAATAFVVAPLLGALTVFWNNVLVTDKLPRLLIELRQAGVSWELIFLFLIIAVPTCVGFSLLALEFWRRGKVEFDEAAKISKERRSVTLQYASGLDHIPALDNERKKKRAKRSGSKRKSKWQRNMENAELEF